jgi:DNA-binding response OmpR family regulator
MSSRSSPDTPLDVLVVDDDASINLLLQTRLRLRGHNVMSAANGREALDVIEARPIDLLLLDVSMPIMGGMEVLTEVRLRRLDTAVVMTTAFGAEQIETEALQRGADDFLRKPFDSTELKRVLDGTIARLQLRRTELHARDAERSDSPAATAPSPGPLLPKTIDS